MCRSLPIVLDTVVPVDPQSGQGGARKRLLAGNPVTGVTHFPFFKIGLVDLFFFFAITDISFLQF